MGDRGQSENVHELDKKKLKDRTVVPIDIANDTVNAADFKKDEDPSTFVSEKTGRGPLKGDWMVGWLVVLEILTDYNVIRVQLSRL